MPDTERSLAPRLRRAAVAACFVLATALPAAAQPAPRPAAPDFFTRYDFHLSAAALGSGDPRFSWDAHFGGDLDLIDYVVGRASIRVDYQAVLGEELRPFDPNQGNYTLEASSSVRLGRPEVAFVLHHVSRHLSDRDKVFPIAWNVIGIRLLDRLSLGDATVDVEADLGRVVQHSFVDYAWTADASLVARRRLAARVGLFARGSGDVIAIDAARGSRPTQAGGTAEAGVRLDGPAGAIELFVGYERRIDPAPTDLRPLRWAFGGFRLVGPLR